MFNTSLIHYFAVAAPAPCPGGDFLGFPFWYKYLPGNIDPATNVCSPSIAGINDVWLIVAAVVEVLLRVGALLAIGYVVWGGLTLILAQGEPEKVAHGRKIILNAVIGLVVAIAATATITYIAGRF